MASRNFDSSPQHKCPACSREMDEAQYSRAAGQLERKAAQMHREQARWQKQEFEDRLRRIKSEHRERMEEAAKRQQRERKLLQQRLREQAGESKRNLERELERMKRTYQVQLENIREIYQNQNITFRNELKMLFGYQLKEIRRNYESLAAGSGSNSNNNISGQRRLETLDRSQKILDELFDEMDIEPKQDPVHQSETAQPAAANNQNKDAHGGAASETEQVVNKLLSQLDKWNTAVEELKEKIANDQQPQQRHQEQPRYQEPAEAASEGEEETYDYAQQDQQVNYEPQEKGGGEEEEMLQPEQTARSQAHAGEDGPSGTWHERGYDEQKGELLSIIKEIANLQKKLHSKGREEPSEGEEVASEPKQEVWRERMARKFKFHI